MSAVRILVAASLWLVLLVACDDASQPSVANFEESWGETVEIVPPLPNDLSFPSAACKSTLASLRQARVELRIPHRDELIANGVGLWFKTAQSTFFECLQHQDLEAAYERLGRIESMVGMLVAP